MNRFLVLLFSLLLPLLPARAALITVDSAFGPATIVRDTDTGLDWARLPVTADLSVREVLAGMEPGGRFEGFRYSIDDEFFGGLIRPIFQFCPPNSVSCAYLAMRNFIDIFGGNREGFWAPYYLIEIQDGDIPFITFNVALFELFTEPALSYYLDSGPTSEADFRFEAGHFIVRPTPQIPEPATTGLFVIGAIAWAGRRRWRKGFIIGLAAIAGGLASQAA